MKIIEQPKPVYVLELSLEEVLILRGLAGFDHSVSEYIAKLRKNTDYNPCTDGPRDAESYKKFLSDVWEQTNKLNIFHLNKKV